jgi:hypothetical protein
MISQTFSWSYPDSRTVVHRSALGGRVMSEKSRHLAYALFWCEDSRAAHGTILHRVEKD